MNAQSTVLGNTLKRFEDEPRSVVGEVTTSPGGNIILRVGHENHPDSGWHQTEHIVLTRREAQALVERIATALL